MTWFSSSIQRQNFWTRVLELGLGTMTSFSVSAAPGLDEQVGAVGSSSLQLSQLAFPDMESLPQRLREGLLGSQDSE